MNEVVLEGWVDLLDPDERQLEKQIPVALHRQAREHLLRPGGELEQRPTLQSHGDYLFGIFLVPVRCPRRTASSIRRSTLS